MLFHHVGVHVSDLKKSKPMYDAIFRVLGYEYFDVPGFIAAAWGTTDCSFRIVQPSLATISASTSHVCFAAPSEEAVKQYYEIGQEYGGKGVGAPESYVEFGHRHLTAMLCDLDGNHVEAVYVDPTPIKQAGGDD